MHPIFNKGQDRSKNHSWFQGSAAVNAGQGCKFQNPSTDPVPPALSSRFVRREEIHKHPILGTNCVMTVNP